jgi:hypothetical protein
MSKPSSEYFVIKPKTGGLPADLRGEAAGSTGLFVLRSATPGIDAREEWNRLVLEHGDQIEFASPVLVDEGGQQSLPTGRIVVDFHNAPSGEALRQFEESYGLRYLKTNEFKRDQLSFEARDHKATYPPDLIARLKANRNVKFAVQETLGRYRRV